MAKKEFAISDGTLTKYNGPGRDVVIPKEVRRIGTYAFWEKNITSVTFPEELTYIGSSAFYGCQKLTSITLPDQLLEIDDDAFGNCSRLEEITFPAAVTQIGDRAFSGTAWLKKQEGCVVINGCLLTYRGPGGNVAVPEGTTEIKAFAFKNCNAVTIITLPDSVTKIGECAFYGCKRLTEIHLPDSVTEIGEAAFCWCSCLTSIKLPASLQKIPAILFSACTSLTELTVPERVELIENEAFFGCSNLQTITILGENMKCSNRAFEACNAEIIADRLPLGRLPQQVRDRLLASFLQQYADGRDLPKDRLDNCKKYIKRMRLKLFPQAMENDRNLFHFILQEKLLTDADFPELMELVLQKNDPEITAAMLEYQEKNLKPVDVEKEFDKQMAIIETNILPAADAKKLWNYKKLPDNTLCITGYKGKALDVIVPNGIGKETVTEIGDFAFSPKASPLLAAVREMRQNLNSVIIPEGIRKIGDSVFEDCERLTKLSLPDSLLKIGKDPLLNTRALETVMVSPKHKKLRLEGSVLLEQPGKKILCCLTVSSGIYTIPRGVRKLPDWIFRGKVDSIKEFIVSEGLKVLPVELLRNAVHLERVVLPASMTKIQCFCYSYFDNCTALAEIVVAEDNPNYRTIDGVLFSRDGTVLLCCPPQKSGPVYTVPDGVTELNINAFCNCRGLSEITIPGSVASIPWGSFQQSGLKRVRMEEGVQEIGFYAFSRCEDLTDVILPASLTKIDDGSSTFAYCGEGLTFYAPAGSYAEAYAKEKNINFKQVDVLEIKS